MMLFPTAPLQVTTIVPAPTHYMKRRGGFLPLAIILHHTGGTDSRAWLSRTSSPPVSTHRLIDKAGTIYKIVPDEDTAYTAGYGIIGPVDPDARDPGGVARNLNYVSLNIELENAGTGRDPYPAVQLQSCALQIAEWWGKYGLLPILYHSHVDGNKDDPRGLDRTDLDRRILAALPTGTPLNADLVRHMELAAGHIQTGLGDLVAALAAARR